MKKLNNTLIILVLLILNFLPVLATTSLISWVSWNESVFQKAKEENKFVILDLEAVWCHWCHVMHEETYTDPAIVELIKSHYIPVRVDQDSRPDLSNRYREYGWPATIVFNSKGEEIIKRAGYIPPDELKIELQKIIDDPSPEEKVIDKSNIQYSNSPLLSNELKTQLINNHKKSFDPTLGGLKMAQKYLDRDSVEYSLLINDSKEKEMAKKTLDAAIMLIDPTWGGVYQYSTMSGWDYPHFEKLAKIQGEYIKIYSLAYETLKDLKYLQAAEKIYSYLKSFLSSPNGVFYISQDADLKPGKHSSEYFNLDDNSRRKLGIPKVDRHIYSSQNGIIINSLVYLYKVSENKQYLNDAATASDWILKHRKINCSISETIKWMFRDWTSPDSVFKSIQWIITNKSFPELGFRHDEKDVAGPYLSDSLNMGQAFLNLYSATKDRKWLIHAEQTARFIQRNFEAPIAGFTTAKSSCEICAARKPDILTDENITLVRFTNNLFKYTHDLSYKEISEHGMRFLVTPEIATETITEPGILIADLESKS